MNVIILSPIYNDWLSFQQLYKEIETVLGRESIAFNMVVVDDGSVEPYDKGNANFENIEVVTLKRNVGHQRAICIGLCYITENYHGKDAIIVLDADGEDKPGDIPALIDSYKKHKSIVFAERKSRIETERFKILYKIYKYLFKQLTGYKISFGNFSLLPFSDAKKVVYVSEVWNHFAGGILSSKMKYVSIPLDRGNRYFGNSKMNLVSLIIHGISSISIFLDIVATRILVFSISFITVLFTLLLTVVGIKLFTDFAIPGWTSTIIIGLLIVIFQIFLISLMLVFLVLFNRNQALIIPIEKYKTYLVTTKK